MFTISCISRMVEYSVPSYLYLSPDSWALASFLSTATKRTYLLDTDHS